MYNEYMQKTPPKRIRAIFFLFCAALCWSLGGLLIKIVDWNPLAISGMRSAIACPIIFLYLRRPKFTWSRAQIAAAIFYAMTVISFVTANRMTTAANAILLQYGAPVYVALWGHRFLGERAGRKDWITITAVLGGMTLFFFDGLAIGNILGNLVAVGSGLSFAFLIVFLRQQKDASPLESVFLGNLVAVLIGLPFMGFGFPTDGISWLSLLLLGVVQIGLAYLFYTEAIKEVTALEGTLIPVIEPILNPLWVFLLLLEIPSPWALVGGGVIILSIVIRYLLPSLRRERAEPLP
ncbi:MAG TPA: EamA family transporter [Atribacteraceae bacterium]|nr:EamA family transporter [Atribacteraceae bacterium]